jgi:23S rRNA (guanosine2251-2'-O)-methyltransferase
MALKLQNQSLKRKSLEEFKQAQKRPIVLVLDNVRSLNNVGSAFRTADAFLIEAIYLCGSTGVPPNKEIEKTALGATESVKWKHFKSTEEAIQALKKNGNKIYAVEQAKGSISLNQFTYANEKTALVFGNEVYGVEQNIVDVCDGVIEIPQEGTKHSLNISVTVGIVLWEMLRGDIKR